MTNSNSVRVAAITEAPELLFERLAEPKRRKSGTTVALSLGAQVRGRNDALTRIAGSVRRKGLDQARLESVLRAVNSEFPDPLPEDEVIRVAESVGRYDPALEINEQALSDMFASRCAGDMRYVPISGWKAYRDGRWKDDKEGLEAQERSKQLVIAVKEGIEAAQVLDEKGLNSLRKKVASIQKRAPIQNIVFSRGRTRQLSIPILGIRTPDS